MTESLIKIKEFTMKAEPIISMCSISKKYDFSHKGSNYALGSSRDFWALRDVTVDVQNGKVLGIIGRNGAGKTTFLNIICGVLSPTEGTITTKGKILGLFNLGTGFQDELTGRENIFLNGSLLGASKKELSDNLGAIIDFSELSDFIDMPLGTYSQGMRLRLGFSIVVNLDFDILIIDEVLAVGDALFQSKCFERLMDLRRKGKTLILTTQGMDLIERLCDEVVFLDHGKILFYGEPREAIDKYKSWLNTDKFFVGPIKKNTPLVESTKKWADDVTKWGQKLGAKEVCIESVELLNKSGKKCESIESGAALKIKVKFCAREDIQGAHFGVAIFREDGVYCYGPNTEFDSYKVSQIKSGKGSFTLSYQGVILAAGKYWVSVAIWDKNETIAFDYHHACYKLIIGKDFKPRALLNISFKTKKTFFNLFNRKTLSIPFSSVLSNLNKTLAQSADTIINLLQLLDKKGAEKQVFMTNDALRLRILLNKRFSLKGRILWAGFFSDDGVYCQGVTLPLTDKNSFEVYFPELPLLPGGYRISCGIWDKYNNEFIVFLKNAISFRMVFDKNDHGIVYLKHRWEWSQS